MSDESLLTLAEVAAYLRVHEQTVRVWARTGKLPAVKFERFWRFRRADVEDFVERRRRDATKEITPHAWG